jgi:hypothetical protein
MRNVEIELIQRVAAEVLEVLLHHYFHIVPCELGAQRLTIVTEFIGNS